MPYDISQLNDMLVPELVDVANHLKIVNVRSLVKQTLIYKILDQQALDNSSTAEDESKKRRTRKPKAEAAATSESEASTAPTDNNAEGDAHKKRTRKPRPVTETKPVAETATEAIKT